MIHDVDWGGNDAAFVNITPRGGNNTITNNTMYNAGRSGVDFRQIATPNTQITHNDISRFGYLTKDLGGIYTLSAPTCTGTVIAYNHIHDSRVDRLDQRGHLSGQRHLRHHGPSQPGHERPHWESSSTRRAPTINVYNNTLWDVTNAMTHWRRIGDLTNVNTYNNLSNDERLGRHQHQQQP